MSRALTKLERREGFWRRALYLACKLRAPAWLITRLQRRSADAMSDVNLARCLEPIYRDFVFRSVRDRRSAPPPRWSSRPAYFWNDRGGDA